MWGRWRGLSSPVRVRSTLPFTCRTCSHTVQLPAVNRTNQRNEISKEVAAAIRESETKIQLLSKGPERQTRYETLLLLYCKHLKTEEAEKVFSEMKGQDITPPVAVYHAMLRMYRKLRKVEPAMLLFGEFQELSDEPEALLYQEMLRICSTSGRGSVGIQYFKEYESLNGRPTSTIFEQAIICAISCGDIDLARHCMDETTKHGYKLLPTSYLQLLKYFHRTLDINKMAEIADEMEKKEVPLTPEVFHYLITAYSRLPQIEKAEEMVAKAKERGVVDASHFRPVMIHYLHLRDFKRVDELYEEIVSCGISLGHDTRYIMLERYALSYDLLQADNLYKTVPFDHIPKTTRRALFLLFARHESHVDEAIKIYEAMKKGGQFSSIYPADGVLISNQMKSLRPDFVDQLYIESVSYYTMLGHIKPVLKYWQGVRSLELPIGVDLYSRLIRLLYRRQKWSDAVEAFEHFEKEKHEPTPAIYNSMVSIYLHRNPEKAEQLYEQMVERGLKPALNVYRSMISLYSSRNEQDKIEKVLSKIKH